MRTCYQIKGNLIDSISYDVSYKYPYFMFMKDDELIVNRNSNYKAPCRESILFDIEILAKRTRDKVGMFHIIKGFTNEFIDLLEKEYKISFEEVSKVYKETIKKGDIYDKNNGSRRNYYREHTEPTIKKVEGYIVGYK